MLLHKKTILLGVAVLLLATIWAASANNLVDQKSVLAGRVIAQGLVAEGAPVKEGAVLVKVESIAGSAVAARAVCDGTVREVLVKPGDLVAVGQTVARIEPSAK